GSFDLLLSVRRARSRIESQNTGRYFQPRENESIPELVDRFTVQPLQSFNLFPEEHNRKRLTEQRHRFEARGDQRRERTQLPVAVANSRPERIDSEKPGLWNVETVAVCERGPKAGPYRDLIDVT